MKLRLNKPLRNLGVYKLRDKTLILFKRSEVLSFLFTPDRWHRHGPVDYRVSHGNIYRRGEITGLTDEDLLDTGMTARQPSLSILMGDKKY
jgi:hypothetical protein